MKMNQKEYDCFRCAKCQKMGTAEEILKSIWQAFSLPKIVSRCCGAETEFPLGGVWPDGTIYTKGA